MFYECTLLKALQMIGVDVAFDFDVAVPNPPWMDANEDGILRVHTKRSRTPVQTTFAEAEAAKLQQGMLMMEDMGLCTRFGIELCRNMMTRHGNDLDRAVDALMQYTRYIPNADFFGRT